MPIAGTVVRPFGALAYEDQGEGPALVFAHGLGGNHLSWWRQVAHFKATHRCIAFSHRGFAPSSPMAAAPDPIDYASDLLALMDDRGVDRAVLVAQSMGGWTAVEFALAHPHRVAGIVFACTTGSLDFTKTGHAALARLPAWSEFSKREAAAYPAENIHTAAGRRMARDAPDLHELYCQIDRMNASLDKPTILKRLWALRTRAPSDLDRIPAPKLFIAGDEDIVIPAAGLEAVAKTSADARFVLVEQSGHSVYFQHAARFNAEVETFLREAGRV